MEDSLELEIELLQPFYKEIFEFAVKEEYLSPRTMETEGEQSGTRCPYHGGALDHVLTECEEFQYEVNKLVRFKILRCQGKRKVKKEKKVNTTGKERSG